jgi:tRNA nucleotidyltransferase (CCA-adding enzyme)
LKDIKPVDESLLKEVDLFVKKINSVLTKKKLKAKAVVGGSVAKNTYLKNDHDCDLFVRFDYSYKTQDISKLLGSAIRFMKPEVLHGSRDYYSIKSKEKNTIHYEIVPVLEIKKPEEAVNVTDMSPLHVEWVKKHSGLCDEIRLAKQFCKASGVYGAESYIKGFSGHVIDILVIHYGGFLKLLKASQKWKEKEVIDPEKYYKKDALQRLNKSKIDSPIIIIDPVLRERNASASLSYEKCERFVKTASDFLTNLTPEYFTVKEKTVADIKKEAGNNKLILIEVEAVSGKDDVVGAKLLKAYQQIRNQLAFYDFDVKGSGWKWDRKKRLCSGTLYALKRSLQ